MSDYEEEEEFGIDPAIAAAMGFTGFGAKPSKKRKFDRNDGFVDPSISATSTGPQGKGANNTPIGERKSGKSKTPAPGSDVAYGALDIAGQIGTQPLRPRHLNHENTWQLPSPRHQHQETQSSADV
ncbi:unnamed protein product [Zymoseptoria tritici ST99CH_3D7]|uniref:Uncharacterized protein n=1 Tax=Zymoseptoria tritici (strain ST99CH_3D7) TaxID=1276538 RepID=A0A1X7RX61_ZYMT9|nr:unnamed protein product [Zymoseptoria tritici ST99CH_3D7]